MAQPIALPTGELQIIIRPRSGATFYYGSASQLEAENLIPPGFAWPKGYARVVFAMPGGFSHRLERCRPPGIKGPMSVWCDADYWSLRRHAPADLGQNWHQARLYEAAQHLADLQYSETPQGQQRLGRVLESVADKAYRQFRQQLLGTPQRKKTAKPQAHGAQA